MQQPISIHALREEGDKRLQRIRMTSSNFYPRPPRGGRRVWHCPNCNHRVFLSTPSARRATQVAAVLMVRHDISIHALREEGDRQCLRRACMPCTDFYPRPPRGGRRYKLILSGTPMQFLSTPSARRATHTLPRRDARYASFLSTPSARRATLHDKPRDIKSFYFYPRPPRGGRPADYIIIPVDCDISIHALREEGDAVRVMEIVEGKYFYPRPPRGGRPAGCPQWTHFKKHFYPRPPRGGRPISARRSKIPSIFLSTPSARRATPQKHHHQPGQPISIHALREEGDPSMGTTAGWRKSISIHALREEGDGVTMPRQKQSGYFYPRPPRGGRPSLWNKAWTSDRFLSTPSARRATVCLAQDGHSGHRFLSTPSARRATTRDHCRADGAADFYPRPPRGGRQAAVFMSL